MWEVSEWLDAGRVRPARAFRGQGFYRHAVQTPYLVRFGRQVRVESGAERLHAHLLDRDTAVRELLPQGLWVERSDRVGWACPDFLVSTPGGPVAVEVKRSDRIDDPLLRGVAESLEAFGIRYEVRGGLSPIAHHAMALFETYSRPPTYAGVDSPMIQRAMLDVAHGGCFLHDLYEQAPLHISRPLAHNLVWRGLLCVDWESPIRSDTAVQPHGGECPRGSWLALCGPEVPTRHWGEPR